METGVKVIGFLIVIGVIAYMLYIRKKGQKMTRANLIKKRARQKVENACSMITFEEMKIESLEDFKKDREVSIAIENRLLDKLNENKIDLNGLFQIDEGDVGRFIINIKYSGSDYCEACDDVNAKITYTIGLAPDGLKLIKEDSVVLDNERKY